MFFFILSFSFSVSTTDCYPTSSDFWLFHGSHTTEGPNIRFTPISDEAASVEYTSMRYRKKWMLSICGTYEDSLLVFESLKPNEEVNKTVIEIFHEDDHLDIKLLNDDQLIETARVTKSHKLQTYCFNIISGRGYFGMFGMNNHHDQDGEQLFVKEMNISRQHLFKYVSRKPSNITRLCIGDFFGNKRVHFRPDDDDWKSNVRDFL